MGLRWVAHQVVSPLMFLLRVLCRHRIRVFVMYSRVCPLNSLSARILPVFSVNFSASSANDVSCLLGKVVMASQPVMYRPFRL
jgi:hypothetical protein